MTHCLTVCIGYKFSTGQVFLGYTIRSKPRLHTSHKNDKHMFANMFFKLSRYGLVSISLLWSQVLIDIESFKVLLEASSQACSAIVSTIWRPDFRKGSLFNEA